MKNWQQWAINVLAALGATGTAIVALNSTVLSKNTAIGLAIVGISMFATTLAQSMKASVLPKVNAQSVLDHAESNVPIEGSVQAQAVEAAKKVVIK